MSDPAPLVSLEDSHWKSLPVVGGLALTLWVFDLSLSWSALGVLVIGTAIGWFVFVMSLYLLELALSSMLGQETRDGSSHLRMNASLAYWSIPVVALLLIISIPRQFFPAREIGAFTEKRDYEAVVYCDASRDGKTHYTLPCQSLVRNLPMLSRTFVPIRVFFDNGGYLDFNKDDSGQLSFKPANAIHSLADQDAETWTIQVHEKMASESECAAVKSRLWHGSRESLDFDDDDYAPE